MRCAPDPAAQAPARHSPPELVLPSLPDKRTALSTVANPSNSLAYAESRRRGHHIWRGSDERLYAGPPQAPRLLLPNLLRRAPPRSKEHRHCSRRQGCKPVRGIDPARVWRRGSPRARNVVAVPSGQAPGGGGEASGHVGATANKAPAAPDVFWGPSGGHPVHAVGDGQAHARDPDRERRADGPCDPSQASAVASATLFCQLLSLLLFSRPLCARVFPDTHQVPVTPAFRLAACQSPSRCRSS